MKLVIGTTEGDAYFDLVDTVPGVEVFRATSAAEAIPHIADADVYYGIPSNDLLAAATNLKWVQTSSTGVDFLRRMPALVERDIVVTNAKGAHAPSVSEHALALLLAMTRAIPLSIRWQGEKFWGRDAGYRIPRELMGETLGVIGYGEIGQQVALLGHAFGMEVLAVDLRARLGDRAVREVWSIDRLHELMSRSFAVVICLPWTPETDHLIDAAAIAAMPAGGYLVAPSRGGILDEAALLAALDSGHLEAAGLDVAETEPLPADSPLWTHERVILTHHLGGSSWQKERRCVEILVENLHRFQAGSPLVNVVDKARGY